jgi:hypothetical protein
MGIGYHLNIYPKVKEISMSQYLSEAEAEAIAFLEEQRDQYPQYVEAVEEFGTDEYFGYDEDEFYDYDGDGDEDFYNEFEGGFNVHYAIVERFSGGYLMQPYRNAVCHGMVHRHNSWNQQAKRAPYPRLEPLYVREDRVGIWTLCNPYNHKGYGVPLKDDQAYVATAFYEWLLYRSPFRDAFRYSTKKCITAEGGGIYGMDVEQPCNLILGALTMVRQVTECGKLVVQWYNLVNQFGVEENLAWVVAHLLSFSKGRWYMTAFDYGVGHMIFNPTTMKWNTLCHFVRDEISRPSVSFRVQGQVFNPRPISLWAAIDTGWKDLHHLFASPMDAVIDSEEIRMKPAHYWSSVYPDLVDKAQSFDDLKEDEEPIGGLQWGRPERWLTDDQLAQCLVWISDKMKEL